MSPASFGLGQLREAKDGPVQYRPYDVEDEFQVSCGGLHRSMVGQMSLSELDDLASWQGFMPAATFLRQTQEQETQ